MATMRLGFLPIAAVPVAAFSATLSTESYNGISRRGNCALYSSEWKSDFDGFGDEFEDDELLFANLFATQTKKTTDLSACQVRQFSLGEDLVLTDFVGSMGFDEVTDWEYYYPDEDGGDDRRVVQPNPLDPEQPKRTRQPSGSVVRVFRAEFAGRTGSTLRAQGLDRRALIKEFSGSLALDLAKAEWNSVGMLQSELVKQEAGVEEGAWIQTASSRSVKFRQDDSNVCKLLQKLKSAPFLGILGEVNLAELEEDGGMDPNEFYRAMGVTPPKQGSIWVVYEYAGLTSLQAYSQPASVRRARLPVQKGFFGNPVSQPPLPPFPERASYVRAVMQQSLAALATLHEAGLCHRSVGRSSLLMGSTAMDKTEAASPYAVQTGQLVMKLADFGFSGLMELATYDEDFRRRARMYDIYLTEGKEDGRVVPFCVAEDLHALGFVFLGLLLTSLADVTGPAPTMPATDEDTLQRLLGDIFEKDMEQFRDYVEAEEVWETIVAMLDERGGWDLLSIMCFSRESAREGTLTTARELVNHPFFTKK